MKNNPENSLNSSFIKNFNTLKTTQNTRERLNPKKKSPSDQSPAASVKKPASYIGCALVKCS